MISKSLAAGLVVASCVVAAGGGAYLAVRHNGVDPVPAPVLTQPVPAQPAGPESPVSETEATVTSPPAAPSAPVEREDVRPVPERRAPAKRVSDPPERASAPRQARRPAPAIVPAAGAERSAESGEPPAPTGEAAPAIEAGAPGASGYVEVPSLPADPPAPPEPRFEELVIPASSVIGLQVETPVSSERARVEDRVDSRVTRDVFADGRVAIPAGSRVVGSVTLVERGGKVKERARIGVRFHTLVLGDGTRVPLRTDAILREGEPPTGESARKIGGAALGGAVLGAIVRGGKGAAIGGAIGAGAGTAAVMAGDRNAATLPAGTVVTIRLSAPAAIEVEKR